jgi:predicted GNAT family acetyltransferase
MSSSPGEMRHVAEASRYEWVVDGQVLGIIDYRQDGDRIEMHHTQTAPAYRGQGIAAKLVGSALEDVRARNQHVVPSCWYVAEYIEAHPEQHDLLAQPNERFPL